MQEQPVPMDEDQFWALVRRSSGDANELQSLLMRLSSEEIVAFDMRLDEVLFRLDRRDIHEVTDGSDDGFEYVRLWIVSRGREYFESVLRDAGNAPHDAEEENEEFEYAAMNAYEEKFGEPMPRFPHRRSTRSNAAGWA